MGCNCRKRRMTQTTAAALAHQQAAQAQQVSSEQVEALVAGAAHTAIERDQPAGETSVR